MLENQNRKKDIYEVVVLTAGSKINDDKECTCEKLWALCDCHAEAMCYKLAGLYMLTEMYKLYYDETSIFEEVQCSGYQLKKDIKFHLFVSYHPCGFMSQYAKDSNTRFLSWKYPFFSKPHIPECSSKILIGAYMGIQGPLSSILLKKVFVSSIVILCVKNSKKILPNEQYITKCFDCFRKKISSNLLLKIDYCIPTIAVIEKTASDLKDLFPNICQPNSVGHQKSPYMGIVLPKVIVNINDKRKKWSVIFLKQQVTEVSAYIENYCQKLKETLNDKFTSFDSDKKRERLEELDEIIRALTSALEVTNALQLQESNIETSLKIAQEYEESIENIIKVFITLQNTNHAILYENCCIDAEVKNLLDGFLKYLTEISEDDKETGKGTKYLQSRLKDIKEMIPFYEQGISYDKSELHTLLDIDCDWKRYKNSNIT